MHGNPEISQTMTLTRFDQIKRFLKLFDSNTDPEFKSSDYEKLWTAKLKPFSTLFQQACKQYLHSGRNVSVDEQLILFKSRFKHIMNILSKKVDRGFKIYCLCSENYVAGLLKQGRKRFQFRCSELFIARAFGFRVRIRIG